VAVAALALEHLLVEMVVAAVAEAQQLVFLVLQIQVAAVAVEAITAQVVHRKAAVVADQEL